MMKQESFHIAIFFAIVGLTFYLFYRILAPFLSPICWAGTFAIIFYPLYIRLERWLRSGSLRSLILTTLIVILIIGPAVYIGVALVEEAITLFDRFSGWVSEGKLDVILNLKNTPLYLTIQERLSPYVNISQFDPKAIIESSLMRISQVALAQTTNIIANAGRVILQFLLMVFFLFYFFRDGHLLIRQIKAVIPFSEVKVNETFEHLRSVIESTIYGGLVVALLQGILGGLMFWIVGIRSPVFWGTLMAFLGLLPLIGPFLIYIPAGLILILSGSVVTGVIVIAVGSLVVSQIDNFLRPMFMAGQTGMHTLLLFISIMGGVSLFGLVGTVVGPLVAAVFVTLFDMFRRDAGETA